MFLGQARSELHNTPTEASFIVLFPQYLIVAVMLTLAFFPQFYFGITLNIIHSISTTKLIFNVSQIETTSTKLASIWLLSIYFLILLTLILIFPFQLIKKRKSPVNKIWKCAYVAPIPKAQYSGPSFTRTFVSLFGFVPNERKARDKISKTQLYPTHYKSFTYYFDLLERFLVLPITKRMTFVLNYFQFIQNGKILSYVIYSLFFILMVFIRTVHSLIS
jgi:hypothetical protein